MALLLVETSHDRPHNRRYFTVNLNARNHIHTGRHTHSPINIVPYLINLLTFNLSIEVMRMPIKQI